MRSHSYALIFRGCWPLLSAAKAVQWTMLDRREFLARCSAAGLGQTLLPGAPLALASRGMAQADTHAMPDVAVMPPLTVQMLEAAASVAGITLTPQQRQMMLEDVQSNRDGLTAIRDLHLLNAVAPAVIFDPRPAGFTMPATPAGSRVVEPAEPDVRSLAGHQDKLGFATVEQLALLLRTRKITSVELTKLYLARLRRFDPKLHFVITYLDDRALAQAAQADRDIAAGRYKGPLHGIPWGAKDLLAVKGYPTTWGAAGFQTQHFDDDATVVQRLDAAGAVLIAKLTLGALAQGDVWFGGRTRNPWSPAQGSSGSSAGSASAVSAGCVGFAIGSETLGSISSPSTRCGVTGYRPTFGLVPRTGAMALSWSMDKLGPIARSAADAALVLRVIHGPDGRDLAVHEAPVYTASLDLKTLRVGYLQAAFVAPSPRLPEPSATKPEAQALSPAEQEERRKLRQSVLDRRIYDNRYDIATLTSLRNMGITPVPVKLPDLPLGSIAPLLGVEAAAAFDELVRSGRDALLTAQGRRTGQTSSASRASSAAWTTCRPCAPGPSSSSKWLSSSVPSTSWWRPAADRSWLRQPQRSPGMHRPQWSARRGCPGPAAYRRWRRRQHWWPWYTGQHHLPRSALRRQPPACVRRALPGPHAVSPAASAAVHLTCNLHSSPLWKP